MAKPKTAAVKSPAINKNQLPAPVVPSAPAGSKTPPPVADEATLAALAAAAPKDDELRPTVGVVARGHTVITEEGTFTAGMKVTASKAEIEKMRARRVLVDPNRPVELVGNGPRFFKEDEAAKGDPN